jgi:hypothetical protein
MGFERKQQQHLTGWGFDIKQYRYVKCMSLSLSCTFLIAQVEYELEGSCVNDYLPPQVKVRSCAKQIVAVLSISQLHM